MNSVSLEGVSHHAAVDILQNAPEDVTLVISQPKEKPAKGKTMTVRSKFLNALAQLAGSKLFISLLAI